MTRIFHLQRVLETEMMSRKVCILSPYLPLPEADECRGQGNMSKAANELSK